MASLLSLFTFIFLASLPGRTTFILIMLSTTGRNWQIFFGAALAFSAQVLISVLAGATLALIPYSYVEIGAGCLFIIFAYKFWIESLKADEAIDLQTVSSIKAVFAIIFTAEIGDVSQLAIATSASRASSKVLVFVVGLAALWIITGLAVVLGSRLGKFLNPKTLQKMASVGFVGVGTYLLLHGIFSTLTS